MNQLAGLILFAALFAFFAWLTESRSGKSAVSFARVASGRLFVAIAVTAGLLLFGLFVLRLI
jgi:hypothetical protein